MSGPAGAPRTIPGVTPALRARLRSVFSILTRVSPRLAARLALTLFLTPPRRRLDAIDVPIVARATRHRLAVPAGEVAALEWAVPAPERGPAASDPAASCTMPTVLLLHGWGSHAARFGSFVEPLLAAGYRVVGIDAPAHGESSGKRSDLAQFRVALRRALQEFAPVVGIVAHSMGASAAVWQLAEEPHANLRGLVLLGMPRDVGYMMESFALVLDLRADVKALLIEQFTRRFGEPPDAFSAQRFAARLGVPTLVVHDEEDDVAPLQHAIEFASNTPGSTLRTTRGLNHSGALRDAEIIGEIVDFLGGLNRP